MLLLAPATTGCLGIANMGDLKAKLGYGGPAGPTARIEVGTTSVPAGSPLHLDGSGSLDPAGGGLVYRWDLGDGTQATGPVVAHAYDHRGTYTVTLTVEDARGRRASATKDIVVSAGNHPPVAGFTVTDAAGDTVTSTEAGRSLHLSAATSSDPDGDTLTYRWDLGDGTQAAGAEVDHAWTDPGRYDVSLTVTDAGGLTATAARTVAVDLHLHRHGTLNVTESNRSVSFAGGPARQLDVVLTFNATAGVNDLDLVILDASNHTVAASRHTTSPGTLGNATEAIHLDQASLASFAPGNWTVRVERARGVSVAYDLTLAETYGAS